MSNTIVKLVALGVLLSILTAGYFGWRGHQREVGAQTQFAIDQKAADVFKREAAEKLDAALSGKAAAERKLAAVHAAQELEDAKNINAVAGLKDRIATLTRSTAGRLRDPNQTVARCGGGSDSPPTRTAADTDGGAVDAPEAAGLLSEQLTEFLRVKTAEADEINTAYISCRARLYADKK